MKPQEGKTFFISCGCEVVVMEAEEQKIEYLTYSLKIPNITSKSAQIPFT